jgi:hypothetical protein
MKALIASISTATAFAWLGAAVPMPRTSVAPFIECGGGAIGRPSTVVVHLLDAKRARHWSMQLESGVLTPSRLEFAGPGTIRIELLDESGPHSCEATAPSPFHLRAQSARFAGTTLRVLSRVPVPVEIQDRSGKVLAKQIADPAHPATAPIGW